jgi:hypothetical protein
MCDVHAKVQDCCEKRAAFNKETLFTSKLDLNLSKKLANCYISSIAFHGNETWTLRKVNKKYLEKFEMWYWRRYLERLCEK